MNVSCCLPPFLDFGLVASSSESENSLSLPWRTASYADCPVIA